MKNTLASLALCLGVLCCNTQASSLTNPKLNVEPHASTLGAGIQFQYTLSPQTSLRLEHNRWYSNYQLIKSNNSVKYESRMNLNTFGLLVDYYLSEDSPFYLSSGLYINNNSVNVNADLKEKSIASIAWESKSDKAGSLKGAMKFQKISPFLGVGYRSDHLGSNNSPWGFNLAAGVLFQGPATGNAAFTDDLDEMNKVAKAYLGDLIVKQGEQAVNQHRWVQYYPVITLGASYSF